MGTGKHLRCGLIESETMFCLFVFSLSCYENSQICRHSERSVWNTPVSPYAFQKQMSLYKTDARGNMRGTRREFPQGHGLKLQHNNLKLLQTQMIRLTANTHFQA